MLSKVQVSRKREAVRHTIPAPIGGLNTRDSLVNLKPEEATSLINYFPDAGSVRVRAGSVSHVALPQPEDSTVAAQRVFAFRGQGVNRLYAIGSDSKIYDVTDPDATIASAATLDAPGEDFSVVSFWARTFLISPAGSHQVSSDSSGTVTIADQTWTKKSGDAETPGNFAGGFPFKNRLYLWEADRPIFWHNDLTGAPTGAIESFDLGMIVPEAGRILDMRSVSVDAGDGIDDFLLIFLENGKVLNYSGDDPNPASGANFSLNGIYNIGEYITSERIGGDLAVMTAEGMVSMSAVMREGNIGRDRGQITTNIQPTLRKLFNLHGASGWQMILHPPESWLMLQAPGGSQYVMNINTGAWCEFRGMEAVHWTRFDGDLYFGEVSGNVSRANVGRSDSGRPIIANLQTAPGYFRTALDKLFSSIVVHYGQQGNVSYGVGVSANFEEDPPLSIVETNALGQEGNLWASDGIVTDLKWGAEGVETNVKWASVESRRSFFQAIDALGPALSVRIRTTTDNATVEIFAIGVLFERSSGV